MTTRILDCLNCCKNRESNHSDEPQITTNVQKTEGCWDRFKKRVHWVQGNTIVSGTCSLGLTGISVATAYLTYSNNWVVFGLSVGIGAITLYNTGSQVASLVYLCAWKPEKAFEKEVKEMGNLSQETVLRINKLNDEIKELKETNQNYIVQIDTEKQLSQTRLDEINKRADKIKELTTEISGVKKSLELSKELVAKWQEAAKQISSTVASFKIEDISKKLPDLEELKKTSIKFDQENDELKEVKIDFENSNSELQKLIEQIHSGYSTFAKDIQEKQSILEKITKEVDQLKDTNQNLSRENQKLEKASKEMEELKREYEKVNNELGELVPILKQINIEDLMKYMELQKK